MTSNSGDMMGLRHPPMAFTEQGVAMLSSVLNSRRAIRVNIQIIKTFVRLRQMMLGHKELQKKIEAMEDKYDRQFKIVFDTIRQLIAEDAKPRRKIESGLCITFFCKGYRNWDSQRKGQEYF